MKNDDGQDDQSGTANDILVTTEKNKPRKKPAKSGGASQKPNARRDDSKPKSIRRSWRAASPLTKITIIIAAIVAAGTLGYLGVSVWQTIEAKTAAHAQHMPLLINSRPPTLFQPFVCDVKTGLHTGNLETGVKNLGTALAYHVMPFTNFPKIVPERKRGNSLIDDPPPANCKMNITSQELDFPLAPGQEIRPQMRQAVASIPPITPNEPVQFYWATCVYYADEYGGKHATCDTYRLDLPAIIRSTR